jgi:hypothetical protein
MASARPIFEQFPQNLKFGEYQEVTPKELKYSLLYWDKMAIRNPFKSLLSCIRMF